MCRGRSLSSRRQRRMCRRDGGCAGRLWQLRKQGANTRQMTRAAGTAAVMYGCDTQGVSNTLLHQQTSTIARAASPPGAGRNPYVALYLSPIQLPEPTRQAEISHSALCLKNQHFLPPPPPKPTRKKQISFCFSFFILLFDPCLHLLCLCFIFSFPHPQHTTRMLPTPLSTKTIHEH